jgi:hypothetical protein
MPSELPLHTLRGFFECWQTFWNTIKSLPPQPFPLEPPVECHQYIYDAIGGSNTLYWRFISILVISFSLMFVAALSWFPRHLNRIVLRHLAEATPREREKELKRLCICYGIKIRKRGDSLQDKKVGRGKGDELSRVEKGG